ncbi:MAG: TaqI family restriction endonuclease [Endomicrobium sp.]|jgi:hypothetical protein|nr:TaqI family restriction endonuclease [Endomicrobium sp.]
MSDRFKKFDNFIKTIDLDSFRKKYSHIKIVEMDLPRSVQVLKTMYRVYWNEADLSNILNFEECYKIYYNELKDDIEKFRIKAEMCSVCFGKGLKARIYRTWASIITQIHAGYVAETIFGEASILMNDELDHTGKDFIVSYNGKTIPIQVKKESKRPESRILRIGNNDNSVINIKYCAPNPKDFQNPRYVKTGELKPQVLDFIEFSKNGILTRYDNGFVAFLDRVFKDIKNKFFK